MIKLFKRIIYALLPVGVIDRLKVRLYYSNFEGSRAADLPESPIFERLLASGGTVLDVGANIGVVAKVLSQMLGNKGVVHSFEPVLYTYRILARNIERAGLTNVRCYHAGIGASDGEAIVEVPNYEETPDMYGKSGSAGHVRNYYFAHLVRDGSTNGPHNIRERISMRSLDSVCAESPGCVALIKIDADGFELDCIMGAKEIIARDRPAIFSDISSDPDSEGSTTGHMTEFLRGYGYLPYLLEDGKLHLRTRGVHVISLFYLSEAHVQILKRDFSVVG